MVYINHQRPEESEDKKNLIAGDGKGRKKMKKYIIEVHHQNGIRTYSCDNLWDIVFADIDYCQYRTIQDQIKKNRTGTEYHRIAAVPVPA